MVLLLSGFDIEYDLTAPPLKFGETRLSWHMDQAYYALTKKLVNRFNEPLSKSSYGIDLPNTPIKKKTTSSSSSWGTSRGNLAFVSSYGKHVATPNNPLRADASDAEIAKYFDTYIRPVGMPSQQQ